MSDDLDGGVAVGNPMDNDDDDKDKLEKTIETFFKIEDEHGFTKSDIPESEVRALAKLYRYAKNPLPLYNSKMERLDKPEKKVRFNEIIEFIYSYIKLNVSKSREGRKEGSLIASNIQDKLMDEEAETIDDIIDEL